MLSEISHRKTNTVITYIWNLKKFLKSEHNKTETDSRYREQTSGYQWGERREERQDRGMGLGGTNYYV